LKRSFSPIPSLLRRKSEAAPPAAEHSRFTCGETAGRFGYLREVRALGCLAGLVGMDGAIEPIAMQGLAVQVELTLLELDAIAGQPDRPSDEYGAGMARQREHDQVAALGIAAFGLIFSQMSSAPGIMSVGVLIAFSNTVLAYSLHAYQSELYPTRIRARAVGFTYGWSRFSTIFIGFIIAFCLRNYGTIGVFVFIAGAMVIVFLVIAIMGPRTTGRRLEAISR